MPQADALDQARAHWVKAVESLDDAAFVALEDPQALPSPVRFHSLDWEGIVFRPGAGPHKASPPARVSVHVARPGTLDFVRSDYVRGKTRVSLIEASSFMYVRFREIPPELGDADPLRRAGKLAAAFLASPAPLQFHRLPGEADTFSSAPAVGAARMENWHDRVDGRIRGDGIAFLVYKFHLDRWDFDSAPRRWFDDAFRAKWRR